MPLRTNFKTISLRACFQSCHIPSAPCLQLQLFERVVCPEQLLVLVQLGGLGDVVDATAPRANNTLPLLASWPYQQCCGIKPTLEFGSVSIQQLCGSVLRIRIQILTGKNREALSLRIKTKFTILLYCKTQLTINWFRCQLFSDCKVPIKADFFKFCSPKTYFLFFILFWS